MKGRRGEEQPIEESSSSESSNEGVSGDGGSSRKLSAKEWAREARRRAYQAAKARRAADPRLAELKEKAKQRRREQYQRVKQQRKEALAARGGSAKSQQRASARRTEAGLQDADRQRNSRAEQHGLEPPAHTLERKPRAVSAEVLRMKAQLERLRVEPAAETELTLAADVDIANDVG